MAKKAKLSKREMAAKNAGGSGTSNATTYTMTIPFATVKQNNCFALGFTQDSGANQTAAGQVESAAGSNTLALYKTFYRGVWTASSTKNFWFPTTGYEI